MKTQPTSEEKFWAVLSHLSGLVTGMGMILPAFGWADNRQKSQYAAFHSLQSLGYQSLGYTLWLLAYLVLMTFMIVVLWLLTSMGLQSRIILDIWLIVFGVMTMLVFGLFLFFPVLGAILCALGRDFRYPILGDRLARYVGYDPTTDAALDELHEERFAASMGHFCVIYPLFGLLVPFGFWASQGGRSPYMKFQSLQMFIFQAVGSLVTSVFGVLAFIILLIAAFPIMMNPGIYQPSIESIVAVFIFLICIFVTLLIVPLYQILGQWAGLRILQGRDYHYPLIGRWAESWMAKREAVVEQEKLDKKP